MDTTEKAYHEVKGNVKQESAVYTYMYKRDEVVHIDNMCVSYRSSDEDNIERMREKTKIDGFLFWAESEEGKQWIKENMASISAALLNLVNR